jgi:hypothetical protein
VVNHVYAHLLNLTAPAVYGPWDEYVPPAYRPRELPADLAAAARLVFGAGADRAGRAYAAARVLAVARAHPNIRAALVDADPRLALRGPRPTPAAAAHGPAGARVDAPPAPFEAAGRGAGTWQVVWDGATARVTPAGSGGRDSPVSPAAVDGGYRVPLAGSSAHLVVPPTPGSWLVVVYAPPAHRWAEAAGADPGAVFRPGASAADDALYAAWLDGQAAWERAAAAAVGLARRTAEL